MSQSDPKDFIGPMDWNDTSNPAVREAELDEHFDFEFEGCDHEDDADWDGAI